MKFKSKKEGCNNLKSGETFGFIRALSKVVLVVEGGQLEVKSVSTIY